MSREEPAMCQLGPRVSLTTVHAPGSAGMPTPCRQLPLHGHYVITDPLLQRLWAVEGRQGLLAQGLHAPRHIG